MKLTEKSLAELLIDQGELAAQRQEIAREKMVLQGELAQINAQVRGQHLALKVFHQANQRRATIIAELSRLELLLTTINQQRSEVQAVMDVRKTQQFGIKQIKELVGIRDQWHEYSMDKAHPQKSRELAFQFSQQLRALLKPYFDNNPFA